MIRRLNWGCGGAGERGWINSDLPDLCFRSIVRCGFRRTASPYPRIVELDNRERETLFLEAVK